MKGDFTRWSFRAKQHYHGVLKQQGRVDLDSDWNEQGAIVAHRVETETIDVIGASGAPQDDAGFMIQPASGGANLTISAGRAYVDGILCENEQANLLITAQPDLPGFALPTTAGTYLAYLEVWERHITYLDDREILEVALGGPDTCTRAKTVWQVNLQSAGAIGSGVTCSTDVPAYDTLIAPSSGKLQAQAQPTAATTPCAVPATAGYTSLENQLYRVEIHNTGNGDAVAGSGTATFKWSRDNGFFVASWVSPPSGQTPAPNTLFVSSAGKDSVLGFAAGQWVELSDDTRELNFQPGTLVQLTNVQGQVLTVDPGTVIPAGGSLKLADYPLNPKVRRWDSAGATPTTTGSWLNLENGVQVQFAKGTYATGDYWLIPARTLTGNIDWPMSGGNPVAESPKGIQKHYCRLAVVQFDGKVWTLIATCLPTFPPLTDLNENGIHVTDVRLLSPDQELLNDSEVNIEQVVKEFGINVITDAAVDPVSTQPTTCFVTVDIPYPLKDLAAGLFASLISSAGKESVSSARVLAAAAGATGWASLPVLGYQTMLLPGLVAANTVSTATSKTNEISWTPQNPAGALTVMEFLGFLLELMPALQPTSRLLTHLTLKGDFIWSLNDPTIYLDGDAFGVAEKDATGTRIGLRLPKSGDGKRGGDFDMWFWLVLPVTLTGLQFSPNPVAAVAGTAATATGTLNVIGTQLTAGNTVKLSAQAQDSNGKPITANIGTVPPSLTLGTDPSPTFPVTGITLPPGTASARLQVSATYGTQQAVTGILTINAQVTLIKLAFSTAAGGSVTSVPGGGPVTLTATLNAAAPTQVTITLNSNASQAPAPTPAATVPATIVVQQGFATGQVTVQTGQRGGTFALQVTGTLGGATQTASLNITAPGAGPAPVPPVPAPPIVT
jgi:Family of unknown function (DUF6519)